MIILLKFASDELSFVNYYTVLPRVVGNDQRVRVLHVCG